MAATAALTIDEFNALYSHERGYEYWFGQVVRKPVPNRLHGILQLLLGRILFECGYVAASGVDVRISREFQPRPDVSGELDVDYSSAYPTKAFEVVMEILSPNDPDDRTIEKCGRYADLGIKQIYVVDPETREAFQWDRNTHGIEKIDVLVFANGRSVLVEEIFRRMDECLHPGEQAE